MSRKIHFCIGALLASSLTVAPARADVIDMPTSCPAGQSIAEPEGCPGHGGGMVCRWTSCSDSDECGSGPRCVERHICVRDVERQCSDGDGRAGPEAQRQFTVRVHERGAACGANGACPNGYQCEEIQECAPSSDPAPEASGCSVTHDPDGGRGVWLGLALGLALLLRRGSR